MDEKQDNQTRQHFLQNSCLVVLGLIFLCCIGGLITDFWPETSLDYKARTSEDFRKVLLAELPIGSSIKDVYRYLSINGVAGSTNQRHGYSFDTINNSIRMVLKAPGSGGGEWFITFRFDQEEQLSDIEVEFYRTLP